MDRKINKTIESYITAFKDNIRDKVTELHMNTENTQGLLQYIYDYERLTINKDDLTKRKRVKNIVPVVDRCCAKRANDEQCTRRKKGDLYCGTHMKGSPNGDITTDNENDAIIPLITTHKIEIWSEDVNGILYYVDKSGNVYQVEDILYHKNNPKIIGKYTKNENKYEIHLE